MREHFRRFDSKISFFAFADIITAVSGMLVFITLLLATDLGRPTNSESTSANSGLERQLNETLAKQAEIDAANERLQGLLADANTAPDPDKLQLDISRLRAELADEKNKHAGMTEQLAASKTALDTQDQFLGITAVRGKIPKEAEELAALHRDESSVRDQIAALEQQITSVQAKIVKLRAREGQLWLIPDRSTTPKEPLLAVVSGSGLKLERFNHPEQGEEFSKSRAFSGFNSYLDHAKPANQYVVFLIRPSGIGLFKDLVQTARDKGFEVGFDALEEDREVHFTAPPPIDDQAVPVRPPGNGTGGQASGTGTGTRQYAGAGGAGAQSSGATESGAQGPKGTPNGAQGATESGTGPEHSATSWTGAPSSNRNQAGSAQTNIPGQTNTAGQSNVIARTGSQTNTTAPPPPPKPKSWWQRFLEWIGIG
jgi:hypothetical protein